MATKKTPATDKPKAKKVEIGQLVVVNAWEKVSATSGKKGFFGQAVHPATGQRYQIIGAYPIG